jgi:hypothetical protein
MKIWEFLLKMGVEPFLIFRCESFRKIRGKPGKWINE